MTLRHADLTHAVLGAAHPRHPCREEGLMLEEVQVAPSALAGVMDLAAGNIAFGASEPGAPLEIDAPLKPTLTGIEGGLDHPPRRRQPQGGLEKLGISHRATVRDAQNQLPTQNGEGPLRSGGR